MLIDGKSFFDVLLKNKEEAYEKIIKISKNNDYTTGNLLHCEYFSEHYKLTAIDLSKQMELKNPNLKQINFIGKLEDEYYKILWVSYKIETQKIINLLNDLSNEKSKFATKRWYVIDIQKVNYKQGDTIKFETETIKLNLFFYIYNLHFFEQNIYSH